MPNIFRKEIREVFAANCDFVMIGTIGIRSELCERPFIDHSGFGKTYRKAAQLFICLAHRKTQHRRRIQTSAQQETDWDIADHVQPGRFFQNLDKLLLGLSF